ncbi:type IV pilus modification PilV family protein [Virgibacillus senegalensis]|uniref:type IV pilus modification PilV family protein n=1 Tax=Virgibacillus senegalensis TaxID=1499679 RepID=UPI00069E78D9|nr:type II secretion system protein [Virgibacillus senegalensis]
MNHKKQDMFNENGLTLVEILVSIAILSIIVTTFFTFFAQAAKTNKNASSILTATYVAENYMEEIYQMSVTCTDYTDCNNLLAQTYAATGSEGEYTDDPKGYHVKMALKPHPENSRLGNVIVKVYQAGSNKLEAQMETVVEWGDGLEEDAQS